MELDFTSRQICLSIPSTSRWVYRPHSERLSCLRRSSTWLITNHDTGATLEYQGQRVLFEWQSLQDRSKMAATCGVTCNRALIVCDSSVAGLVFAERANCANTKTAAATITTHFNTLKNLLFMLASYVMSTSLKTSEIRN